MRDDKEPDDSRKQQYVDDIGADGSRKQQYVDDIGVSAAVLFLFAISGA